MGKVSINFIAPNKGIGFYLIPAIYFWVSDFTCIELRDIMGFKSYGVCFKLFKWQMGFTINIKPKTYKDDNKCYSAR